MLGKLVLSVGLFLVGVQAQQTTNCDYQSLKCGSVLLGTGYGYTSAQLIAAVNDTASIPVISDTQLSQTLFHCTDIYGAITGNAYCFAGCDAKPGVRNDQCIL
ncbi:hypothetical protein N7486_002984 [Penicillium sp. IBT 16267x]|nr:hypothetical protein N7486_002984 [Penicillium sp. IBT 16267x]